MEKANDLNYSISGWDSGILLSFKLIFKTQFNLQPQNTLFYVGKTCKTLN